VALFGDAQGFLEHGLRIDAWLKRGGSGCNRDAFTDRIIALTKN
jgi:hypothetical protein